MQHKAAIATRLADALKAFAPAQVLCPFPVDGHADQQACTLAFGAATGLAGWQGEVLGDKCGRRCGRASRSTSARWPTPGPP